MVEIYDEIIISSGGNKAPALIGALNEFSKNYPIDKIKYYTGCSAGAMMCLFLNLGYSINDLNNIIFQINFGKFQELKIINLIEKCGLDEGIKFSNLLKATIINKNYNPNITFKELYELTNKILTICVVNITKGITEYHNYINTPDLSILLSTRMSLNMPIVFSPILYNNNYYIDGALLDPFPYFYNKKTRKCGLWLFDKSEFKFIKENEVNFIKELSSSITYVVSLLKIVYTNYIKKYYKKIPKNVVYIDFDYKGLDSENFDIPIEDRIKIFNIGQNKCKSFFNKKFKLKKKDYLAKKYYYLWKKIIKNKKNV